LFLKQLSESAPPDVDLFDSHGEEEGGNTVAEMTEPSIVFNKETLSKLKEMLHERLVEPPRNLFEFRI